MEEETKATEEIKEKQPQKINKANCLPFRPMPRCIV